MHAQATREYSCRSTSTNKYISGKNSRIGVAADIEATNSYSGAHPKRNPDSEPDTDTHANIKFRRVLRIPMKKYVVMYIYTRIQICFRDRLTIRQVQTKINVILNPLCYFVSNDELGSSFSHQ